MDCLLIVYMGRESTCDTTATVENAKGMHEDMMTCKLNT